MTLVTDQPGIREPGDVADPGAGDPYAALFHPEEEPPVRQPATGRLFRSAGASSADGVLPAISSSQASKLRTMVPASEPTPPPLPASVIIDVVEEGAAESVPVIPFGGQPEAPVNARANRSSRTVDREKAARGGRLTGIGVYAVVIGVTLVAAFINVLFFGPDINAITGVALATSSIAGALLVRRADDVTAIIAPPLAIGLVAITAAQVDLTTTSMANRFITAFFTLGNNWIWIIGSAMAAMVVVAVRRRGR